MLLRKLQVDKRRSAVHVARAILSQIAPPDSPGNNHDDHIAMPVSSFRIRYIINIL